MLKYLVAIAVASVFIFGCQVDTKKCLEKAGFKSCEDLKAAQATAQGSDEAYRFLTIAKKCHCEQ